MEMTTRTMIVSSKTYYETGLYEVNYHGVARIKLRTYSSPCLIERVGMEGELILLL